MRKGCKRLQDVSAQRDLFDAMVLCRDWIGGIDEETDQFGVFDEIKEIFRSIDNEAFREEQRKKGWLIECARYAVEYYGVAPLEIIYQLYRLCEKGSMDDMIDLLWDIPRDLMEASIIDIMDYEGSVREQVMNTEAGYLLAHWVIQDDAFWDLTAQQADKEFYIPTVQQMDQFYYAGYDEDSSAYKRLRAYLTDKQYLSDENADMWCARLWESSRIGESPMDVMHEMTESYVEIVGMEGMQEFASLIMNAHNDTRILANRGHKPSELRGNIFAKGMPTIVPASSMAASVLGEAAPQLRDMGFKVDLDSGADDITTMMSLDDTGKNMIRVEQKIYPNDPCPCGSGKKYKKCCGRR